MKYVAFIDTLGFKQRVNEVPHEEAKNIIRGFNQSVFNLWRERNLNHDHSIKGRTFSDSIIIHSEGDSIHELSKIIDFLVELYRISIVECDLPLRGGIAIGDYDDIQAVELDNLQKGLVVGSAFIDAYQLESSYGVKGSKLLFGQVDISV